MRRRLNGGGIGITKYDASITVEVVSTTKATSDVDSLISRHNAKVISRQTYRNTGSISSTTIVLSLPLDKAEALLTAVRALGETKSESVSFGSYKGDVPVSVQIVVTERNDNNYARGRSRVNVLAGVSAVVVKNNGLTKRDLNFDGWGLTVSLRGRSAQLTILSLKLDKSIYTGVEADPESEKERQLLERENSGSMALINHSIYSSFFGGGKRSFLNPFAGVVYGYGHLAGKSLAAIGGQFGIDIINIGGVILGSSANMIGLYNSGDGATSSQYDLHVFLPF